MKVDWSLGEIVARLAEIKSKGFIPIPPAAFRSDEGAVGQILEREFGIEENNLHVGDLGQFELKGLRKKSTRLTLCHKTTDTGLTPLQVFDRFGYIKPSRRDPTILKKKLFTTVSGSTPNSLGLILRPKGTSGIEMYLEREFICGWELVSSIKKISQIVLVLAETMGRTNASDEQFHYTSAFLMRGLRNLDELVKEGSIVIDFAIDQPIDSLRQPHDRGPHLRMPVSKFNASYLEITPLL